MKVLLLNPPPGRREVPIYPMRLAKAFIRQFLATVCAILGPLTAAALDPNIPLNQYERRQWTMDDGLPGDTVTSVIQDSDGELWIGTNNGLALFDGTRITTIQPTSHRNDEDLRITAIHQGPSGTIWFATEGQGVSRWVDGTTDAWSSSPKLGHASVTAILEDSSGRVWIATADHGLMVFDEGRARWLTESDGWEHTGVTGLIEDQRSHVWAGTLGGGVCRFSGQGPVKCADFAGLNIIDLEIDAAGNILVLSDVSIARVPPDRKIARWPFDGDNNGSSATAVLEDRDGCRWLAARTGLDRSHGETTERLTPSDGFPENKIFEILEDHAGRIWIGTDGAGLLRLSTGAPSIGKASE